MTYVFEFIIFGSLSVILVLMAYLLFYLKAKNVKLMKVIAQQTLNETILVNENRILARAIESSDVPDKEGFIKFLSESRDSAFIFIENVQQSISRLKMAMLDKNELEIDLAHKELINFLPENSDQKNGK
jgi:predicted neuraminidase